VAVVSTPSPYVIKSDVEKSPFALKRLAVVDYGIKQSILNQLKPFVDEMMVLPYNTTLDEIKAYAPDAVFLSNGPGDPNALPQAINLAKQLMVEDISVFGICLGHQILSIACGATVVKMPFGHHGGNHPVRDLTKNINLITAQNHSYCVDDASIPLDTLDVTHINLNDNTIEGIRHKSKMALSVQFHPEAGPGPHDAHYLFEWFFEQLAKAPALV
jgi:carbamoyl-phosphate synthase small subunit